MNEERIESLRAELARLRERIWGKRRAEDRRDGTGWVGLDYVAMNRCDEINEEIDRLVDEQEARRAFDDPTHHFNGPH